MTGSVDHERAPLFDRLTEYAGGGIYPLHTPGHKGGRFADADLASLVGRHGLALDLPGMTATDNTFHPTGCVRDAQRLASDLVGAEASFFLAAGSTLGVATALVAVSSTASDVGGSLTSTNSSDIVSADPDAFEPTSDIGRPRQRLTGYEIVPLPPD